MCWNENISLNTFLFSAGALLLIYYSSTHTQYKLTEFNNPYMYLVVISVFSMQLIEYFLWRSIKTRNAFMNKTFSIVGWFFLFFVQPIAMILVLSVRYLAIRNIALFLYILVFVAVFGYKAIYNPVNFSTGIGKNGHLLWRWGYQEGFEHISAVFYYLCFIAIWTEWPIITVFFAIVSLICYFVYNYEFGSMFCWFCNFLFLYFLAKLLLVLPFQEYRALC